MLPPDPLVRFLPRGSSIRMLVQSAAGTHHDDRWVMDTATEAALERLLATSAIRDVVYRYCRGIDRRDLELVRSCYHADARDEHGGYVGGVEGFLQHALAGLSRCERTLHFIGNVLVEVEGDRARCESYALAFHRLPGREEQPPRDRVVALRYLDVFTRRSGEWRIALRRCVSEWTRTDPVGPGWDFPPAWLRGEFSPADPISDERWRDVEAATGAI